MELRDNLIKRELYLFWSRYPNVKFGRSAIKIAVACSMMEMDRALKAMVGDGLVETHIRNGVTLYSLTMNEEKRRPFLEFARRTITAGSQLLYDYSTDNK